MKLKKTAAFFLAAAASLTLISCSHEDSIETEAPAVTDIPESTESTAIYDGSSEALKTENLTVTKAELSYVAYFNYQQFRQNYSDYLEHYGLDVGKSLKEQKCTFEGYDTWYDYFMEYSIDYASQIMAACEAALAAGYTLSDDEKAKIDEAVSQWNDSASEKGYSNADEFIKSEIKMDFTVDSIKSYTEKTYLSSKYFKDVLDSYVITDKEISEYFEKNKSSFIYVDYLSYTFYSGETLGSDAVKVYADDLAKCTDSESFKSNVKNYVSNVLYIFESSENKDQKVAKAMSSVENMRAKRGSGAFFDWAFGNEAKAGKTFTNYDEESGVFSVYLLTAVPYKMEMNVRSARDIKLTKESCETYSGAVKKAQELLEQFNSGAADEDAFAELASQYSEDVLTKSSGGLIKDKCDFEVSPQELSEWIFSGERAPGDVEIIKSDGECHLVYYVDKGLLKWQYDVRETIKYHRYAADIEALIEKYTVSKDEAVISDISM